MTRRDLIKAVVGVVLAPVAYVIGKPRYGMSRNDFRDRYVRPAIERVADAVDAETTPLLSPEVMRAVAKANVGLFNPPTDLADWYRDAEFRAGQQWPQTGTTVRVTPPKRYATRVTMYDAPHIDPDQLAPLIDSIPKRELMPRVLGQPNPRDMVVYCGCPDLLTCPHPWPSIVSWPAGPHPRVPVDVVERYS